MSCHLRAASLKQGAVNRFARFCLVSALMISIGGQWALLQSAAWLGMAVSYSFKAGSVAEGLSQTFDGDHPCPMCCALKKSQEKEESKERTQGSGAKLKFELFAENETAFVGRDRLVFHAPARDEIAKARPVQPEHGVPEAGLI